MISERQHVSKVSLLPFLLVIWNKIDLPVNRKGVDDNGHALLRGHVAQALDKDEAHDCLALGEARID